MISKSSVNAMPAFNLKQVQKRQAAQAELKESMEFAATQQERLDALRAEDGKPADLSPLTSPRLAEAFTEAVDVTGLVLTKLDGTAKGGVVVAIAQELGLPIRFIGVGENMEDLLPFSPADFVRSLFET